MPAITITDLENAKTDVDHIADIANSADLTAMDRLGNVKNTVAGWNAEMQAHVDAIESAKGVAQAAMTADVDAVDASRIAAQAAMTADVDAVDASRVTAQADMATDVAAVETSATTALDDITAAVDAFSAAIADAETDVGQAAAQSAENAASAAASAASATASAASADADATAAAAAAAASGNITFFVTKAAANTGLAALAANTIVDVLQDESDPEGNGLVSHNRYQKQSGAYVFLRRISADVDVLRVTTQKPAKLSNVLARARGKVLRVIADGTSIANSTSSALHSFLYSMAVQYGWSGNATQMAGLLGGGIEVAYQGWEKQVYGGMFLTRLRGNSASTALDIKFFGKRFLIRHSKEADGEICNVQVDGVNTTTLNCSGAQSYGNEVVLSWSSEALRTITIQPPASGYIYLESYDTCRDKNGVHIIDATLGGSALAQHVNLRSPTGAQVAGIAIVGNNGIDSVYAPTATYTKPDLVVLHHTVNDAGLGSSSITNTFLPAVARIVSQTKAIGAQLVIVVEMAGHHTLTGSSSRSAYMAARAGLLAYADDPHVTVLDWHGQSWMGQANVVDWATKYYSATSVNDSAGTYSGDFIHPNADGYALLSEMFAAASVVPVDGRGDGGVIAFDNSVSATVPYVSTESSITADNVGSGAMETITNSRGEPRTYRRAPGGSRSIIDARVLEGLLWSEDEINYEETLTAAIAAAATSDQYGKYLEVASVTGYTLTAPVVPSGTDVTVTMLMGYAAGGSSVLLRPNNSANTSPLVLRIGSSTIQAASVSNSYTPALGDSSRPQLVHFRTRTDLAGRFYMPIMGRVYGIWVTPTAFPCITPRRVTTRRELGAPMKLSSDITADKVLIGQTYLETVNSKTIEKVAIARNVWKASANERVGLYRCQNRTAVDIRTLTVGSPASQTYSAIVGGDIETSASNPNNASASFSVPNSLRYTLSGRMPSHGGVLGLIVYWYDGGTNTYYFLSPSMVWTVDTYGNRGNYVTVPVSEVGPHGNFAVTFDMPASGVLTGTKGFYVIAHGGTPGSIEWTPLMLAEGNSALI